MCHCPKIPLQGDIVQFTGSRPSIELCAQPGTPEPRTSPQSSSSGCVFRHTLPMSQENKSTQMTSTPESLANDKSCIFERNLRNLNV